MLDRKQPLFSVFHKCVKIENGQPRGLSCTLIDKELRGFSAMSERDKVRDRLAVPPLCHVEELEERLSEPSSALIAALRGSEGDLLILGAGGKVGPGLARMAMRAAEAAGARRRIIAVSRFSNVSARDLLEASGVETLAMDLEEEGAFDRLPDAPEVLYLLGRKFGSTGAEWRTWHTNVYLAGEAARRFKASRIVAFSSGNIYPFVPVDSGGATETTPPAPVGEYAMTCLGRERIFDHFANEAGARVLHFRLNYAAELRYGVLYDVARRVWNNETIDLRMGYVNVVWQGYVNEVALRCLPLAQTPARILNITGPETLSIRWLAERFGARLNRTPRFQGEEAPTALLSNASACFDLFGRPEVSIETLIDWVAYWVASGGPDLGKPTHFETRDGKF
jgi:nucleoside-diphosphate-sugar epimerase